MGKDLDPDEEQYYEEIAEETRVKLRALAPRGTALLLRVQKDPKYEGEQSIHKQVREAIIFS
jgi:hypothetical protein